MLARHQPQEEAEAHWVEELVFVAWRQRRLRGLEELVLTQAALPEPASALPSLATLIRHRGRLASEELASLRRGRKDIPEPPRLRWLADRIEHANAIALAYPPPAEARTNEIDLGTNEPSRDLSRCLHASPPPVRLGTGNAFCANLFAVGPNEPNATRVNPAQQNYTNELVAGTNEPRQAVCCPPEFPLESIC